ncbi:MAG: DUF896 domain-containing protein [Oscillospiraceae bacterium]|nr:DUF896 domain-containing protein [Oscillospiraceae bacterium]
MDAAERNARINALARKKRAEGLTEDELQEQQRLRLEYLREFRQGMEQMLESIVVEQPDGSVVPLRKRSSS